MKTKAKILVIDDEQGIRDLFKFLLEPLGYQVFAACDGLEGIEMVKKSEFDIIFLDVHMPKMQGPEVLKIIKEMKPTHVVIIFSSSSDPNHLFESKAKELGAYTCIYKPMDVNEILDIINKALENPH
ncbi:MAG: hypothetical protein A2539_09445 [Elusimicrobia bacterium RIFOXYD2_FULL_34_15]|nr:MAG: hypothetical protein A2539_09445 [Elusimicrobia bacterium RIFOXYD2_FULL_34_15]